MHVSVIVFSILLALRIAGLPIHGSSHDASLDVEVLAGGYSGGGGDGDNERFSGSFSGDWGYGGEEEGGLWIPDSYLVTSKIDGLPQGHDKVTTYGKGLKTGIKINKGLFKGWLVGGGSRDQVYGNTFHPTTPLRRESPWGFVTIATLMDTYPYNTDLHNYYQNLPKNLTRPGGELVEMKITPFNVTYSGSILHNNLTTNSTPTTPFFFVSDNYTAFQVQQAVHQQCSDIIVDHPIPFNSTGNIQLGGVVQYYRGDTAAIIPQGYEDAKKLPDSPNLMPNPPFPLGTHAIAWMCLNSTIGESIPLMYNPENFWKNFFSGLGGALGGVSLIIRCLWRRKQYRYGRMRGRYN